MKILIVDDNAEDRTILRHYLAHFGGKILEAADGAEGIEIAKREKPDLIISDALMPNVDGFEFLREVRRSTELCGTPFIFYSAVHSGSKGEELALSLGADAFMVKPLEAEEFLKQLESLLEGVDRTKKRVASELLEEDEKYLREYSQMVAARLEEQVRELEVANSKLAASDAYNRMLFDQSPIGLALTRMEGKLVDINSAYANMIGRTIDETLNLNYWDITPEKYAAQEQQQLASLGTSGVYGPYEKEYIHKDGHLVPVRLQGLLIERNGEKFIWSSVEDITESKQAEDKIHRLANLYAALSECSQAIVRCRSEEELFREICRNTVQNGGMQMAWIGLVDPETRLIRVIASYGASIEYLQNIEISVDADTPSGQGPTSTAIREKRPFWCQDFQNDPTATPWHELGLHFGWKASGSLPLYRAGAAIGALIMYSDVINAFDEAAQSLLVDISMNISFALDNFNLEAERKQAEAYRDMSLEILQILNEPEDLHESIQQIIATLKTRTGFDAVGIRLQDGDDFPYFAQKGFPKDFLLKENSLIERTEDGGVCRDKEGNVCLECTCGLVMSGKSDPANPLFTAGGSFWTNDSFPLLDIPPDEDPRIHPRNECIHQGYASFALVPIRSENSIVGLLQFNDRRKGRFTCNSVALLEGISAHIGEMLMRKRAEEEKLALEQQFMQAQKFESLGVLAGGIAHDFNNILTVIICNCSLLQQRPAMSAELVPEIETAAQRAADLCRQMLIYAGKAQPIPTKFNVKTLVEEMVKMLRATIKKNVTITLDLSTDIPSIKADASQIRQVVMNLIINASEAIGTEQGNITVTLAIAEIEAGQSEKGYLGKVITPGSYICLKVTDNGCGMDEGTKQRIFEPFYTTKFTGRGLGMSAVLGIIKAHNGALQLTSQQGEGTTFKIYLPVQSSEPVGDLLPYVSLMPWQPWQGSGTILLVEDEPQLITVAKALIQALGFSVIEAANGQAALELYQKNALYITLVLTDIGMPVMDGYQLIRELKILNPELPIIVSSGSGETEITSCIHENIAGVVSKPYSFDQLREALKRVVEGVKGPKD